MKLRYLFPCTIFFLLAQVGISQNFNLLSSQSQAESEWVDSVFAELSTTDKIAQMMMLRAFSNGKTSNVKHLKAILRKYKIGALCFFQGNPQRQAELTRTYQEMSNIPLLIGMDAEWGLGMRFKEDAISFPRQMTLGAVRDKKKIYQMGYTIGKQLKMIGVHLNFAPVVDINTNRNNPVINTRAFGDERERVAEYGIAYMRGLQDAGIAACAKHFPGHGDTKVDSHKDLPVIPYSRERLDSIELYPFKKIIHAGVECIMVAHLNIPAYEKREGYPTTLSPAVVSGLLKRDLHFKGLVITDAMEMKAVTKYFEDGEAEALAIMAGNDMICLPANVEEAITMIKKYIKAGKIPISQINQSVKKILRLKYRLKLNIDPFPSQFTEKDIFNPNAIALKRALIAESITLVKNDDNIVPIHRVNDVLTATVGFGHKNISTFQRRLSDYSRVIHFTSGKYPTEALEDKLLDQARDMDIFIAAFHDISKHPSENFGISEEAIDLLKKIQRKTKLIVVLFGSPYATALFEDFDNVIVAYQDDKITQDLTAQALYGAIPIKGRLPVTASSDFKHGTGIIVSSLKRLGYAIPESVGMSSDTLKLIDSLMAEMIEEKASPGCQVLVARNGKIVYYKGFGTHTYKGKIPVLTSDIYDVASITKTAATTISLMRLQDEGRINVNDTLGKYFTPARGTNKGSLVIKDILSHTSGLIPWIPFYVSTLNSNDMPDPLIYHKKQSRKYSVHVADHLWMKKSYQDSFIREILDSPIKTPGEYVYSDLGLIMLGETIKEITGLPLNKFANKVFYAPLGLKNTVFNPYKHYTMGNIVPTEDDDYFRYQLIHGYVHDMNSAILGGVAGHAGLFTNGHDLAVIYQMLLNCGYYGGMRYLNEETVKLFTHRVPGSSRRGIGFDMKQLDPNEGMNLSPLASEKAFGHLGFTGCAVWADPEYDLIYILLSNRVNPTMENEKFVHHNYRPRVQSIVYRAIKGGESS